MKSRKVFAAGAAIVTLAALAACSSGGGSGKTELRVATFPPGADAAAYEAFAEQEAQFEDANPGIDIIGVEYEWKGPTFAVQLAAGSLPDVFTVPFTDAKTLLQNGQLNDVTEEIDALGYTDKFNPIILDAVTGDDGHLYGFPRQAYAMGLHYNRDLFEAAGLDPDAPPTTWDEVREAARAISEATGKAGFMEMTMNNTGGWQLVAASAARGGSIQTGDAASGYTSTINNPGTAAALEYLHDLRWEDNSLGSNFLLDWGSINQEFAAGNIGMYSSGSDVYTALVRDFGLNPDSYGLTVIPIENDGEVLGGGDIAVVSPGIDAETKAAAVEWIDWYYMQKLLDEDAAKRDAEALVASGQAVGTPVLPVLDQATYEESQQWIADYVNVPLDQMSGFFDGIFAQTPTGEPKGHTQEIYALLDPIVQAVLTDENADIDALLTQADQDAQAILDAG